MEGEGMREVRMRIGVRVMGMTKIKIKMSMRG